MSIKPWLCVSGIILVGVILVYVFTGDKVTLTFSEQQVQEQLEPQLPIVIEKAGLTIVVTELIPTFHESDHVNVYTSFTVTGWGINGSGVGQMKTGIEYADGNFYASDVSLEQFDLTDIQSKLVKSDEAVVAKKVFDKFKNKLVGGDSQAESSFDALTKKYSAKIRDRFVVAMNETLQSTPIYSLNDKDMKHSMASLALQDVYFSDKQVEVVLNPLKAVGKIALMIVAGIIILIIVIVALRAGAFEILLVPFMMFGD